MMKTMDSASTLVRRDKSDAGQDVSSPNGSHLPDSSAQVVRGRTLDALVRHAPAIAGVWSRDVQPGDWVVVRTRNSVYSLMALGDGRYRVAGGWFTVHGCDNLAIRIAGCTWGGCAIHTGVVAAPGMWLEFGNGVRTTCIREVRLLRGNDVRTH
jgi:hypothetical protein